MTALAIAVAIAGGASATLASADPRLAGLIVATLALGLLSVGLLALRRSHNPPVIASTDTTAIIDALDRVSRRVFEPGETVSLTAPAEPIGAAIDTLERHVRAIVGSLENTAQSDPLTGFKNRAHFQRLVERDLARCDPATLACFLFIDIDGFRDANETLGHNLGDRLLQALGERIETAVGYDDGSGTMPAITRIARFGGDEFVIFLTGFTSADIARRIANRVLRVIGEPLEVHARVAGVTASIGMALTPNDAAGFPELLRAADAAMIHAKRLGGNRVEPYTRELDADRHRQAALERDLREALARGEFELHYQPQYDCRTMRITSAEALIRWHHPQRGMVSPVEFIPLAEKSNLICDIGEWVVREAADAIARFERLGMPVRISVNVSPQQLEQIEFVSIVKAALARSKATPCLLEVEITESLAMHDCEMAAERLARLADQGISIAIDDFGTGYSNLACLISLPVSRLKIDRSLLQGLTTRPEVQTLAQTIISMANGLGFHTVAEGIEDADQLNLLSDMGCDVAQGFYLSRPVEERALEELVAADRALPFPTRAAIAC